MSAVLSLLEGKKAFFIVGETGAFAVNTQQSHFTGQERGEYSPDAYRALLLLPFNEEQVRRYLANALWKKTCALRLPHPARCQEGRRQWLLLRPYLDAGILPRRCARQRPGTLGNG